jgi:hypothetical protein
MKNHKDRKMLTNMFSKAEGDGGKHGGCRVREWRA